MPKTKNKSRTSSKVKKSFKFKWWMGLVLVLLVAAVGIVVVRLSQAGAPAIQVVATVDDKFDRLNGTYSFYSEDTTLYRVGEEIITDRSQPRTYLWYSSINDRCSYIFYKNPAPTKGGPEWLMLTPYQLKYMKKGDPIRLGVTNRYYALYTVPLNGVFNPNGNCRNY